MPAVARAAVHVAIEWKLDARDPPVTTVLIAALAAVVLYLGKRWIDARSEVAELQAQVAVLKRRLARIAR